MNDIQMVNQTAVNNFNPGQPDINQALIHNFQPIFYDVPVQKDIRHSFAADLNHLQPEKSSPHIRSLIATFILIGGVGGTIAMYFKKSETFTQGNLIFFIIVSYIVYMITACVKNDLHSYISHVDVGQSYQNHYNSIRGLIGRFKFYAECWHNQQRTETRQITDSDGNKTTQTVTIVQKVVTHTATQYATPNVTDDISGETDRIRAEKNIVFIHFLVNYRFKNEQSRQILDQTYYNFRMNNTKDQFQSFSIDYQVPGLVQKQAFYVGQLKCKFRNWFYLFGIIGLIWPYSIWVESKVDRFSISFMKVLTF